MYRFFGRAFSSLMRFSISASTSMSWRRRSSCSRSSGVPWSRNGSVAGRRASSRRTCVSSCCCVCCICSICLRVSSLASPSSVSAEGGSGEVARPAVASPPPARLAWAMACAFSGGSPERELTRITSSGESSKMRLNPAGSTMRTVRRTPCTPIEAISATCNVDRRPAIVESSRCGFGDGQRVGAGVALRDVDGDRERTGGVFVFARVVGLRHGGGGTRAFVEPRGADCAKDERKQVDGADAHANPRAARQWLGADCAKDERKTLGADEAVFHDRGVELGDPVLQQELQRPVALDRRLEGVVVAICGIEVGNDRKQRHVLRLEGRRERRGAAVAGAGHELPLVDEIDIPAQRRGRPRVLSNACLLYTSDAADEEDSVDLGGRR